MGEVNVSGSKNAALPIMAASILNKGITVIDNAPDIRDVKMMCSILERLGCSVTREENKIIIDAEDIKNSEIPEDLMREMRSSVIIAGALIGRLHECKFTYPGGYDFSLIHRISLKWIKEFMN